MGPLYFYGVPLGPLSISSLTFLFKDKNAKCSHENLKRVWNLPVLKHARLKNASVVSKMALFMVSHDEWVSERNSQVDKLESVHRDKKY